MTQPVFYQIDLGQPLSAAHNTAGFWGARIGRLVRESVGRTYIREAHDVSRNASNAPDIWRVVFVWWTPDDNQVARFMAFSAAGTMLPEARFGVSWDDCQAPALTGAFAYPPLAEAQHVPVDNRFVAANQSGYVVQVLDRQHPSEGCAFGCRPDPAGKGRLAPVIGFQLLKRGSSYPNDYKEE